MQRRYTYRFSLRELIFFLTFACIVIYLGATATWLSALILMPGLLTSIIVLIGGQWLYRWTFAGVMLTCVCTIAWLLVLWLNRERYFFDWEAIRVLVIVFVIHGGLLGTAIGGLRRVETRRLAVTALVALGFEVGVVLLLLPRID